MKVDVVPGFMVQIVAAAAALKNSPDDHVMIKGADNKMLVKDGSAMGEKMLAENMVLFPKTVDGSLYLICIAVSR